MNNKEIAEQLFETKFIKALYNTSLERSFINKIIAEELLREAGEPEPRDISSIFDGLKAELARAEKEEEDPIANIIEIFMLAAKLLVIYGPKLGKIAEINPDFLDAASLERGNKFSKSIQVVADRLGQESFKFVNFYEAVKNGKEVERENIVNKLKEVDRKQLKEIYDKLKSTAAKVIRDLMRDIDEEAS